MRIAQLDLKAFGHFTDRRIEFGAQPDFHITYGPNEAGKTTLSRALRAALFGIPERTADNFLHANPNLRVGVVLAAANGEQLAAMRRKARKNSLLRYDPSTGEELSETIPDERLSAWMGGLTEGLYTSMFGLDHDELVAGGKALSEGKGELGQILFEAGAGLSSVRALRERLAKEADELFRPRASTSVIYQVLNQYSDARKEAKDSQTKPAEWETLCKAESDAQQAYDHARHQQENLQRESRRLERLAAVLPDVAARTLCLERLASLGDVVKVASDAPAQRIEAETRLRQATAAREEAANNRAQLQAELDGICLPEALLQEGGAIEALYYSLDAYRAARNVIASASTQIRLANAQAESLLAELGATRRENLRSLIPSATLLARVQNLVTTGAKGQAELTAALRVAATTEKELRELNDEIAELGAQLVPASMVETLRTYESEGNPEAKAAELNEQIITLFATLSRDVTTLNGGSLETLVAVRTPLPAELLRFKTEQETLQSRRQSLKDKIENIENDLAVVRGEFEGLTSVGDIPTAEHLTEQRNHRDSLWQQFRRKLFPEASETIAEGSIPSPGEYELAVQTTDATADMRFADAARVSQHAELVKRLAQMRNAIDLERERQNDADQQANTLKENWQTFLKESGLPDLSMGELHDWLAKRETLIQRYENHVNLKGQASAAEARAIALRASLSLALSEVGLPDCGENEPITAAIGRARNFVEQATKNAASHKVLAKKKKNADDKLRDANQDIESCRQAVESWKQDWTESMAAIHLDKNASSEEASARLKQFAELEDALDTLDSSRAEQATAEATVSQLEDEVVRICEAAEYDRSNRPHDAVAETLHDRLEEAEKTAQRYQSLVERIKECDKTAAQAEQSLQLAETDLAKLKASANCETLAELVEAETRSAEHERLTQEIAAIETRLVTASALPLQELLVQAEGNDLVQVKSDLDRITLELKECTSDVEALHAKLIEAKSALGRVDGEATAAAAEQTSADAAARLANLVVSYSSARLASTILADVIETYQQRYQGPLLARASELFATITGGRFSKVATDFDEDMTILVGVRANGKRERVNNLSSGTRDQLFLALRLAAIESHVSNQEPMPVVVDDIVINFDDAAAGATFKVLAELSRKTQVLFFTHHEHLLDRATDAIGLSSFSAHELQRG